MTRLSTTPPPSSGTFLLATAAALARKAVLVDGVLGGWQFSVINTASGLPVNLNYSPTSQFQVSGYPTYRPNIIGNPVTPGAAAQRTT